MKFITDIYLEKNKFRKPEKIEMLKAMKKSRLGMYEFVSRDPRNAISVIRNIITKEEILLTDTSFGENPEAVMSCNFVIGVIHYQDIYFQTGMIRLFKRNNVTRTWVKSQGEILVR